MTSETKVTAERTCPAVTKRRTSIDLIPATTLACGHCELFCRCLQDSSSSFLSFTVVRLVALVMRCTKVLPLIISVILIEVMNDYFLERDVLSTPEALVRSQAVVREEVLVRSTTRTH